MINELYDNADAAIVVVEKRAKEIRKRRNREKINNTLKPCPFCGGKGQIEERTIPDGYTHYEFKFVRCSSCGAQTVKRTCDGYYGEWCSDEEIAELWNHRVERRAVED